MNIIVYKKTGGQQDFCWDKLSTSIKKSCLAVGNQPAQAELFADQVCRQLRNWLTDKNEITSYDLCHQVKLILNDFNPEASDYYQTFKELI